MTECPGTGSDHPTSESDRPTDEADRPASESDDLAVEWRYDASNSRALRVLAHGFVAGLGGPLVLVGGSLVLTLPGALPGLGLGPTLFVALLVLVGGPISLLYLWPMVADADQRPSAAAFTAEGRALPWTVESTVAALAAGAALVWALAAAGVPFDALYGLVVVLVFSPVLVNLFSTEGRVEDDRLVCNGRELALSRVTGVRSVRVGNAVVCWASYARGSGLLAPRLLTIPADAADEVRAALARGVESDPPRFRSPDRAVRLVVGGAGLLFAGVAVVASRAVDDPVVGTYVAGVFGLIGILLLVAAWRGV